jgi:hypothetical protein
VSDGLDRADVDYGFDEADVDGGSVALRVDELRQARGCAVR